MNRFVTWLEYVCFLLKISLFCFFPHLLIISSTKRILSDSDKHCNVFACSVQREKKYQIYLKLNVLFSHNLRTSRRMKKGKTKIFPWSISEQFCARIKELTTSSTMHSIQGLWNIELLNEKQITTNSSCSWGYVVKESSYLQSWKQMWTDPELAWTPSPEEPKGWKLWTQGQTLKKPVLKTSVLCLLAFLTPMQI